MSRPILLALVLCALVSAALMSPGTSEGAVLTVNSNADSDDGSCDGLPNDCTLREAMNAANNSDTIRFDLPCGANPANCVIKPITEFPHLDNNLVTIDGYSQTGASPNTLDVGDNAVIKVEVNLSLMTDPVAFRLTGDDNRIKGLAIHHLVAGGVAIRADEGVFKASILGNFIGLQPTGGGGGNSTSNSTAISLSGADNVRIGTTNVADRNVIGNLSTGMALLLGADEADITGNYIGTDPTGTLDRGMDQGINLRGSSGTVIGIPGNAAWRNVIVGNDVGIEIGDVSADNWVQGNFIGVTATGTQALPNTQGVFVWSSGDGNYVGRAGGGNIISGNTTGVEVHFEAQLTRIEGNRIGTDPSGTSAMGNGTGIRLFGPTDVTIGSLSADAANLISGNTADGILITNNSRYIEVMGNLIGTDLTGTSDIPNEVGVNVEDGSVITIGGGQAAARNIMSGNFDDGVHIGPGSSSVTVSRNYIGTNQAGTGAIPNSDGITDIGVSTVIKLNVISGNDGNGIYLDGLSTVIQGNIIGAKPNLTALPNDSDGILASPDVTANVENIPSGPPNVIAYNGGAGIRLGGGGAATSVISINRNSIFANDGLGIDLGSTGVTANDPNDGDAGGNSQQNWPVLATAQQGSTHLTGTLDTLANRSYLLEVYTVSACDASGHGEGALYAGKATLTTGGDGEISFAVESPVTAQLGSFLTATVTDTVTNETSEFSNCVPVTAALPPTSTPPGQTPGPTPITVETPGPTVEITDAPTPTPTPAPEHTTTPTPVNTEATSTANATTTATPSGTARASATPAGSQTPAPTGSDVLRQGDNDCSGQVRARDALFAFFFLAELPAQGFGACPEVGDDLSFAWGNVDCFDDIDEDDAIAILLWLAGLDYERDDGCTEMGEEIPR